MSLFANLNNPQGDKNNVYGNLANLINDKNKVCTKLSIPNYQREYVWSKKECSEFWNDFYNAYTNKGNCNSHFINDVLLCMKAETNGELLIVDGQQRLTSMFLILSAIKFVSNETNFSLPGTVSKINDLKKNIDAYLKVFETNSVNNDFYNDYVINRQSIDKDSSKTIVEKYSKNGKYKINQPLKEAFDFFYIKVEEGKLSAEMDEANRLKNLFESLTTQLEVAFLICNDEKYGFRIFETLNNRGKNIDEIDLIKNKLCEENCPILALNNWVDMRKEFDDSSRFQRYVRYYYAIKKGKKIQPRSLYSTIKQDFDSGNITAENLIKDLYSTYKQTLYFSQKNKQDQNVFKNEAMRHLAEEFCDCSYDVPLYVMIACFQKGKDEKDLYKIFSLCFNTMYRFKSVLGGKATTIEKLMLDTAVKISNNQATTADTLTELYNWCNSEANDFKFENAMKTFKDNTVNTPISYALLRRIESYPSSTTSKTFTWTSYDRSLMTLEHILPSSDNRDPSWKSSFMVCNDFKNRLGNHCLLEPDINSSIKMISFKDKLNGFIAADGTTKKGYKDSTIHNCNQSIASAYYIYKNYTNWGEQEVNARQDKLANEAVRLFPIDPQKLFSI